MIHHIIPKHEWKKRFGTLKGVNAHDNLSPELYNHQHAQVHALLYELNGYWEDDAAYRGLSQLVNREELLFEISSRQGKKRKGCAPWNKGKIGVYSLEYKEKISRKGSVASSETKEKMSQSRRGRIFSTETRNKLSASLKGIPKTEKHRKVLSEAGKGKVPWNKGIPASEEHRKANSRANKGRVPWNKGRKLT